MVGLGRRRQVENYISRQIEKNLFDQILLGHPACKIDVYADQAIRADRCPRFWSMAIVLTAGP